MNIINQVMDAIKNYGRVKLYEKNSKGHQCEVYDLFVTEEGKLKAIKKIEIYDIPYITDGVFDETAELLEVLNVESYQGDDINILLSFLIDNEFYSKRNFFNGCEELCVKKPNTPIRVNNDEVVGLIYTNVMKMLTLSNHDLTQFLLSELSGTINIMLEKVQSDTVIDSVTFEEALKNIEERFEMLLNRHYKISQVYQKGSTAKNENELYQAQAEWKALCNDYEIIALIRK